MDAIMDRAVIHLTPPLPLDPAPAAPAERPAAERRLGRVVSTSGAQVIVLLDADAVRRAEAQMGSLVHFTRGDARVFGIIEGLSNPMPRADDEGQEFKVAEVGLLGEVRTGPDGAGSFRRGVSKQPSLDEVVQLSDQADTGLVYALPNRQTVCLGSIHQDPGVSANVSVNDTLGRHFAILGTTGTGKSCALTLFLKRVLERNSDAHILLLDPHGEYGRAFGDRAEHLSVETFRLPYWLLTFEEMIEVVFGEEKQESVAEIAVLREMILAAKLAFSGDPRANSWISVDTPVPYTMADINRGLDAASGGLDNRVNLPAYLRVKSRLTSLQADRRYAFMFSTGLVVRDNLAPLLGRIFRVPSDGRPLAILDLAGVPSEVLNVVVAVLCRMAFDFATCVGQRLPVLLVCEEAHRYAPQDNRLGFEPAKRALARIAKEGRKYGISLGVLSQRPSELDSSILSQCNTVFAFRLTNQKDQEIIQASLSEASSALFNSLPFLANGEAIVVGEGVAVPMRMRIAELPPGERPRSSSAPFSDRWQAGEGSENLLSEVVGCWRGQRT